MFKRSKKCFGVLLVLFTIFGLSLNAYSDVSAVNFNSWSHIQTLSKSNLSNDWIITDVDNAGGYFIPNSYSLKSASISASGLLPNSVSGSAWTGSGSITIRVAKSFDGGFNCPNVVSFYIRPEQGTRFSESSRVISCEYHQDAYYNNYVITAETTGQLTQVTTITSFFVSLQGTQDKPIVDIIGTPGGSVPYVFISGSINMTIGTDPNLNAVGQVNQSITNQTIIIQEHYEQENQAYENISNQSSSDIQGAENQQTTNIIGVISAFASALTNIESDSCSLDLPFPNFVGGTVTANPCSFKDKAPDIVTIGSSLLLICVFVPLAFVVLKMIYNEIRSWTNG